MSLALTADLRTEIANSRQCARDAKIYQRLSALLWLNDGMTQGQVADHLGVTSRQVRKWVRLFREQGLEALCTLNYLGGQSKLTDAQVGQLKDQIQAGAFHTTKQVRHWLQETFGIDYTRSGVTDLLHRLGASHHQVTGFFWKANPDKQDEFLRTHERQKREADHVAAGCVRMQSERRQLGCRRHDYFGPTTVIRRLASQRAVGRCGSRACRCGISTATARSTFFGGA